MIIKYQRERTRKTNFVQNLKFKKKLNYYFFNEFIFKDEICFFIKYARFIWTVM